MTGTEAGMEGERERGGEGGGREGGGQGREREREVREEGERKNSGLHVHDMYMHKKGGKIRVHART